MNNPAPQPPTDAEKLASVCRALRPSSRIIENTREEVVEFKDGNAGYEIFRTDSLDDLARILRELTEQQRTSFDVWLFSGQRKWPIETLTAPLPVLLDALWKSVCNK